jgi:hypothetical protein
MTCVNAALQINSIQIQSGHSTHCVRWSGSALVLFQNNRSTFGTALTRQWRVSGRACRISEYYQQWNWNEDSAQIKHELCNIACKLTSYSDSRWGCEFSVEYSELCSVANFVCEADQSDSILKLATCVSSPVPLVELSNVGLYIHSSIRLHGVVLN